MEQHDNARALIAAAEQLGVKLWIEGEDLRYRAAQGALSDDLRTRLRSNRAEVTDYLRARQAAPALSSGMPEFRPMGCAELVPSTHVSSWKKMQQVQTALPSTNGTHAVVRSTKPLDAATFEHAFEAMLCRHDALHTTVEEIDGRPWLRYGRRRVRGLESFDLSEIPEEQRLQAVARLAGDLIYRPLDLSNGPLWRGFLIRLARSDHVFGFVVHHFICDAISVAVLLNDVLDGYRRMIGGKGIPSGTAGLQYRDYLLCMDEWLQSSAARPHLEYWDAQASGVPRIVIAENNARPAIECGSHEPLEIDADLTEKVRIAAKALHTTSFVIMLAAQKVMLFRCTGQTDIAMGAVINGRELPALRHAVGYFADRMLYRTQLGDGLTFVQAVERVKATVVHALPHRFVPFDTVNQRLSGRGETLQPPFFNFFPRVDLFEQAPWTPFPIPRLHATTVHPEWLYWAVLVESEHRMSGRIQYNGPPIKGLTDGFIKVLSHAIAAPEQRLQDFPAVRLWRE